MSDVQHLHSCVSVACGVTMRNHWHLNLKKKKKSTKKSLSRIVQWKKIIQAASKKMLFNENFINLYNFSLK